MFKNHKSNCSCCICKAIRGELSGKNCYWFGKSGRLHPVYGRYKDKINYESMHVFVRRRFGKATKCENSKCSGKSKHYEWSNISGKYLRDKKDWKQLCRSCHMLYDKTGDKIWIKRQMLKGKK